MIRLERTRQEPHGLGEIKALTSEMYVFLASEPFGRWPTGRNRLVCVCVLVTLATNFDLYCTSEYEALLSSSLHF